MKVALALEYDGSPFHGWQSQPGGQTVQDHVERALSAVAGHAVRVYAAGRTDAGVHAALMPAHFETEVRRQPSAWVKGGNAHLPATIKMLWAKPVRSHFHARHSSQRRYYQYILLNQPTPPALLHSHAGHCPQPLELAAMRQAARFLRGEHDFSAFRAAACQAKSPRRHLYHLRIRRRGCWLIFDFCGNGFLHHMVRNIVGALLYVGRQRQPPQWIRALLAAGDRNLSAPTAAAAGLYFNGALYDATYRLPPAVRGCPLPVADRT